jgi:hypothetical protein
MAVLADGGWTGGLLYYILVLSVLRWVELALYVILALFFLRRKTAFYLKNIFMAY